MPKRSITQIVFVLFVLTVSLLLVGCGEDGDAPAATTAATTDDTTAAATPGTDPEPVSGAKMPSYEYLDSNVAAEGKYQLPPGSGTANNTKLEVLLADKKGNYNFFESGTNVFLMTESGLASNSDVAVADETGHVVFDLYVDGKPKVATETPDWVAALRTKMESDYPESVWFDDKRPSASASPLNGYVSVVYYVRGEEQYDDDNGNFQYDAGEAFEDTDGDPYVDYNGNNAYDVDAGFYFSGTGSETFTGEKYIDVDGNGSFTPKNNKWDGDKWIFKNETFLVGASLPGERIPSPRIAIKVTNASGGLYEFTVVVCDDNYNEISSGSTIAISVSENDAKILSGRTSHTVESAAVRIAHGDTYEEKRDSQIDIISYPMTASATGPITITVNVTSSGSSANNEINVSLIDVPSGP